MQVREANGIILIVPISQTEIDRRSTRTSEWAIEV